MYPFGSIRSVTGLAVLLSCLQHNNHLIHRLCFNNCFPHKPGLAGSLLSFLAAIALGISNTGFYGLSVLLTTQPIA